MGYRPIDNYRCSACNPLTLQEWRNWQTRGI